MTAAQGCGRSAPLWCFPAYWLRLVCRGDSDAVHAAFSSGAEPPLTRCVPCAVPVTSCSPTRRC